ncbi:MAG: pyridoxal phosphate-dependent aminotransferase [Lentisphaerae bacterium]|nr:pyridoxal phosphate-dependent aminotransferase [Lentisphaerota bacterium]
MQLVSTQIAEFQKNSSWIRRMFEAGGELKKKYGAENVYDFSLGSPDLTPPAEIVSAVAGLAAEIAKPAGMGYMPNAGYEQSRQALADWLNADQGLKLSGKDVVLTVGAAGGLNALFRAVLSPGEEVICPAPYFVEYGFYCGNYGAKLRPVKSRPLTFTLDLEGIAAAINEKTRAVIINSPNNPSGVVYSEAEIRRLGEILQAASEKFGRPIFLVSDEPYRFLTFDGCSVPAVFKFYKYAVIVSSFSKNLALAGERVGYVAVNPAMENSAELVAGVIFTNRILGFVNAPCLGQKVLAACVAQASRLSQSQFEIYAERRRLMAEVLDAAGLQYQLPAGTFYFFPKAPEGCDDVEFIKRLQEQRILAVPGTGFGYPGYFRLALCVDKRFILAAAEGFRAAMK